MSTKQAWVYFWLVGLIWGSSFMLIRIGVAALHPFHVVAIRLSIAAIGLCLVIILLRKPIPRDWHTLRSLIIIGIGNAALPFTLISLGEQSIDSGLASVLQATAALFSLVIAHFAFTDERMNPRKVAGLVLGFVGVIILASRNWQNGQFEVSGFWGQMAIVGASFCYATFTTFSRKIIQGQIEPIVLAAITMLAATLFEFLLIFGSSIFGNVPRAVPADLPFDVLMAVLTLGFVNTFIAYLMYYDVVRSLGVARAAMVTYIVPVVGLLLGVIFLDEQMDIRLVLGAGLIFTGIGVVNIRNLQFLRRTRIATSGSV